MLSKTSVATATPAAVSRLGAAVAIPAHEQNRSSWNAATARHRSHKPNLVEHFVKNNPNHLFPEDMQLLGDLRGKTALHLQCNDGQDTVSLAMHKHPRLVVGVDISDTAVDFARELAAALRARSETGKKNGKQQHNDDVDKNTASTSSTADTPEIEFVRADVVAFCNHQKKSTTDQQQQEEEKEADDDFASRRFDVVYTSYGAVCWQSDLGKWASGIANSLEHGGRFVLIDFHPVITALNCKTYEIEENMISGQVIESDGVGDYVANDFDAVWKNPEKSFEHTWGTADIITALLEAGLSLQTFKEYDHINGYEALQGMQPRPKPPQSVEASSGDDEAEQQQRRSNTWDKDQWIAPKSLPRHLPMMYGIVAVKK